MLKPRLQQVAEMVQQDSLIDIGTDHGYLLIDLIQSGKINSGLAVEVAKGPLNNVETNVKNHRIKDIKCVLSDGLKAVDNDLANNYEAVSICGMGGALIAKIITDSLSKFSGKTLYLQPNNGEPKLRQTLIDNGFAITDEQVLVDNDIWYEVIKAEPGSQKLTAAELYFGPVNINNINSAMVAKYNDRLRHLQGLAKELEAKAITNPKITAEIELIEGIDFETK